VCLEKRLPNLCRCKFVVFNCYSVCLFWFVVVGVRRRSTTLEHNRLFRMID
jgi:hypothetical protein